MIIFSSETVLIVAAKIEKTKKENSINGIKRDYFLLKNAFVITKCHTFAAKYENSYQLQNSIIMEASNGKYIFGVVKVGERGQIVIPKEAREQYNIKPGDSLMVLGDQRGIAMLKTEVFQDIINQAMGGATK